MTDFKKGVACAVGVALVVKGAYEKGKRDQRKNQIKTLVLLKEFTRGVVDGLKEKEAE